MPRLEDLERLRDDLRGWLDEAEVGQRASLVNQYRVTLAEIAALTPDEKAGDGVDEIAARRAARGGATARTRRTAGEG